MTNRQIYTTKDAAVIYNISIRRARYLAQLRGIGTKVGGKICFTWAEIKALKPEKPGYPKGRLRKTKKKPADTSYYMGILGEYDRDY